MMKMILHHCDEQIALKDVPSLQNYDLSMLVHDSIIAIFGADIGQIGDLTGLIGLDGIAPRAKESFHLNCDKDFKNLFMAYEVFGDASLHLRVRLLHNTFEDHDQPNYVEVCVQHELMNADFKNDELTVDVVEIEEELCCWSDNSVSNETNEKRLIDTEKKFESEGDEDDSDYNSDCDRFLSSDDEVETLMAKLSDKMHGDVFETEKNGIIEFEVGQIFKDVEHFKSVLEDYKVQEGFRMKRIHNTRNMQTAKCKTDGCPWRIHASKWIDGVTFKIKTYGGPHTCVMQCRDKSATSKWIAKKYEKQLKSAQGMTVGDLGSALIDDYGVHVDVCKLHRARKKVTKKYMGDHEVSYNKLPKYAKFLRKYNSGVTCKILCEGLDLCNPNCNPIFKRFFVSFVAQREGFVNGCRPFIGVDGCVLKNPFGGQLLCAVTLDANSSIFPIAVMISEGENQDSWEYFLDCLHWHLGDERYLTFMSDRQKGLINAIKKIYPNAKHRYCAWHRYNNFKSLFPGPKFRNKFWAAVKATNVFDFKDIMDEIKQENTAAWNWLMQEEPFSLVKTCF
ncbi:uncharacterized protein [Primulina eburnea]